MWLVETGSADPMGWADVDEKGIKSIFAFSAYDFARGVVAARSGNVSAAEAQARRLRARSDAARANAIGVVASRYDSVTPEELEQGQILATALEGAILFAQGKRDDGLDRVREAIARADSMAFEYGPPYSVKPLDELLGDLLLTAGKPVEAAAAYRRTLAVHPNRRLAVAGLNAALGAESPDGGPDAASGPMTRSERPVDPRP
jgi:predicted Zn-dependent protease